MKYDNKAVLDMLVDTYKKAFDRLSAVQPLSVHQPTIDLSTPTEDLVIQVCLKVGPMLKQVIMELIKSWELILQIEFDKRIGRGHRTRQDSIFLKTKQDSIFLVILLVFTRGR